MVKVIEVGDLKNKFSINKGREENDESKVSVGDVAKYVNGLTKGQSKEDLVDALEKRIDKIKGFDQDDLDVQASEDKGEFDFLISSSDDATVSAKAKNELAALVATLSDNLQTSRSPSTSLVFRKDSSDLMDLLIGTLSAKSSATEDNLKYVQSEVRSLITESLSRGKAASSIDAASMDYVTKMFSSDASTSTKATLNLIRQVGLSKLTKPNSGFLGALSRSYGSLGKQLASFVENKVKDITTKPIDLSTESSEDLDEGIRNDITEMKREIFDDVFNKIEEKFNKLSSKKVRPEDKGFLDEYKSIAQNLYTAKSREKAEEFAKELVKKLAEISTRGQEKANIEQGAKDLARDIARQGNAKDERYIPVSMKVLKQASGKLTDDVKAKLAELYKEQTKTEASEATQNKEVNKEDLDGKLDALIKKAGSSDDSKEIKIGDRTFNLSSKQLKDLKASIRKDGQLNKGKSTFDALKVKPTDTDGKEVTKQELLDSIRTELQSVKDKDVASKQTEADRVAGLGNDEIIDTARVVYLPLSRESSQESKDLASTIESMLGGIREDAKKDKKYYEGFLKTINREVLTPILTKAPTIAKTNAAGLMASIIDESGALNEEFFADSFQEFTDAAQRDFEGLTESLLSQREGLERTAAKSLETTYNRGIVNEVSITGIRSNSDFISKLAKVFDSGTSNADVFEAIKERANQFNIDISSDEDQELLDASKDANLSGYDQLVREFKRTKLLAKITEGLNKYSIPSSKNGAERAELQAVKDRLESEGLTSLNRERLNKVNNYYSKVETKFVGEIDGLTKQIDVISGKTGTEPWEMREEFDGTPPPAINKILTELETRVKSGLKQILGSLGLLQDSMVETLRDKVGSIDEDTANSALLNTIHTQLVSLAGSGDGSSSKKPEDA